MVRLVFRFLGILLLAAAFAALIVDGTRSVAAGAVAILPLGRTLSALFPTQFERFHAAVAAHAPIVWDPGLVVIFKQPAWLVLGVLGILVVVLTRRPRQKIGYARR